ncbi:response regulator transcription factor [Magnetospirillum sp. UT-4]|uniref:response regulator n=1 Tax=Magnetospirillum sp. UT-4 TaxID=2681467 RepID=UPI00137E0937|nr:response regulator transcription factor [Magnetospirillum sp. UT-4]CAA7613949.1 Glycerol metabolism activator [Magnetospirillum sp. UT-4]
MKVLLVDDHALFREGIRLVLESLVDAPIEVTEASDFLQALEAVRADPSIEIALVDLCMPGMDGFTGLEALRHAAPDTHTVVVSASEDPEDVRRAFTCGAVGYITKGSSTASMMEGIRTVLGGESYLSPNIRLPDSPEAPRRRPVSEPAATLLTPRQRDVLGMLRHGKSNKEIARDLDLAEITVKLHVTAILRALGVENRTQAAILAARMGL